MNKRTPFAGTYALPDFRAIISLLATAVLLAGCAGVASYHPVPVSIENLRTDEGAYPVSLAHVEIDDQGELQDYKQIKAATDKIIEESKHEALQVIVFVHGWNNNASDKGGQSRSLRSFKAMLPRLAKAQKELHAKKPFGVFVSWRGRTLKPFTPKLDYFHRYAGAQRAGGVAATQALYEIGATAREANSKNRVLMVGHSFGGLLLEEAVGAPVAARLADVLAQAHVHSNGKKVLPVDFPADLIVLVNEAEKAVRARTLIEAFRDCGYDNAQLDAPFIASITGSGDGATKTAFGISTFLGRSVPPFNTFNTTSSGALRADSTSPDGVEWGRQKDAQRETAGHFKPIQSHAVRPTPGSVPVGDHQLSDIIRRNASARQPDGSILISGFGGNHLLTPVQPAQDKRVYNTTPYWVMEVPPEIIKDHGDIWNDDFVGLVTALMHLRKDHPAMSRGPASVSPMSVPPRKMLLRQF